MDIVSYQELAERYAPLFGQKVGEEWPAADQIAPLDYAIPTDIKASIPQNPHKMTNEGPKDKIVERPTIYYSVVETTTHWFIIYAVYHPVDWYKYYERDFLKVFTKAESHAHDMEGAMVVVHKDPEPCVDAIFTISHKDFYFYVPDPDEARNCLSRRVGALEPLVHGLPAETIDGHIEYDEPTGRPMLFVQAHGHGIRGDRDEWKAGKQRWWYHPKAEQALHPEEPAVPEAYVEKPNEGTENENKVRLYYELKDFFADGGLWSLRYDPEVLCQGKNGQWHLVVDAETKDKAPTLAPGKANPPWSWNDIDDPSPIGEIATDPAQFILRYAQGWGPVSREYIYNPYLNIGV